MKDYDALKLENQLCFPLYAVSREITRDYRPFLGKLDLTYTQYIVMMVLWEEKKISVKDLGAKLFLDSGTLTPLLKTMEKKGLLRRYRCSEDERVAIVEISAAGEILKEDALAVPAQIRRCLNLEEEEAKTLYRLLRKMLYREKS